MNSNVSVITPSYNRVDFIGGALKSILGQTYQALEHIVIDGGSSDGTVEMLQSHQKSERLKYISESDSGMYDAINKGLNLAEGEILAYLNTDDRYLPWTVQCAVTFFERNPDIDIVYGDTIVRDMVGVTDSLNIHPTFSRAWLKSGGIIPQPTVFFRRKVYERLGPFQREVTHLADCEYWLRADSAGFKIAKINEVLAVEINHVGTIREKMRQQVADEKSFLIRRYKGASYVLGQLILRAKYLEKEFLVLRLVSQRSNQELVYWSNFLSRSKVGIDVPRYYLDKLLRTKSHKWRLGSLEWIEF